MESKPMTTSEPTTALAEYLRTIVKNGGNINSLNRTELILEAADRLESQERDIETLRAFHERYAEQTSKKYIDDICALTARAEQAECERDKAKADMKLIVDAVRETHCDETCCFACKYDCDMSINDSGEFNNECPGFDRDDCFEWRGLPQDGEG